MNETGGDAAPLAEAERARFAELADVLVPAAEDMPSASEVGAHDRWLDRAVAARPELLRELRRLLEASGSGDAAEFLARAESEDPETVEGLLAIAAVTYYMSPKVRKRLGYPGQRPRPLRPGEAEHFLRDGLIDPVVERGPIYRQP